MHKGNAKPKKRICALDLLRGTAVILMLLFHLCYTFGTVLGFAFFERIYYLTESIAPPVISVMFIFSCAYSCRLSKNNLKRGAIIFLFALGLSFVTIVILPLLGMAEEGIYFGILHFLGIAVMLSPLIFKAEKKIPAFIGIPISIILAIGTSQIMTKGFFGLRVTDPFDGVNLLFPFGIYHGDFFSADYYPIFPWIFVFALCCYIAAALPPEKLPERFYSRLCPPVEFLGRHAMIVYIIHQPIIYLIGEIILKIT